MDHRPINVIQITWLALNEPTSQSGPYKSNLIIEHLSKIVTDFNLHCFRKVPRDLFGMMLK